MLDQSPSATVSSAGSVVIAPWSVVVRGIFLRISMVVGGLLNGWIGLGWVGLDWVGTLVLVELFFEEVMRDAKDTVSLRVSDQCSNDQTNWLTRPATEVLARKNLDILTPPSAFLLVLMASVSSAPKFCLRCEPCGFSWMRTLTDLQTGGRAGRFFSWFRFDRLF